MCIDKLDDKIKEYNKVCRTIKMKSIDFKTSTHIDFEIGILNSKRS